MRQVFLCEPYGGARLLAAIFGEDAPLSEQASLPGHAIRADAGGLRLAPARLPGAETQGAIYDLGQAARERLDFWMAAIGTKPLVAGATRAGRRVMVDTYLLPREEASRDWTRDLWAGEWHDLACEAAEEAMRHFGERDVKDMPGLMTGIGFRALARARGAVDATPVGLRSGLGGRDVEPLRMDLPYAEYFCVEEHWLRHRRFDGEMSAPILRAAFTSGDAVTVLPYDPVRGAVLLIEQFRAGPLARRDPRPWCLEAVAGRCDPMEAPEQTARREAREEAELELGRLERVAGYYPSPGIMAEYIIGYVGEADLGGAGGNHGLAAEQEDIRAIVLPLEEALAAVASGEVNNAPLLLSLQWLEKHRARLSAEWGGSES